MRVTVELLRKTGAICSVEWFLDDLKRVMASGRRIVKHKLYLALTAPQRQDLADTLQELVDELQRINDILEEEK